VGNRLPLTNRHKDLLFGNRLFQERLVNQQIDKDRIFADNRIKQDLKGQIEQFMLSLNETAYQIYSNPELIESIALNKQFLTDSRTYDTRRDIQEFFSASTINPGSKILWACI